MPDAFIVGGMGQIGQATAACLIDSGWAVTVAHRGVRSPPPALIERRAKVVALDRDKPGALARALASGADVLIDMVAYDRNHARQLLEVQDVLGALIVVSSSSVYRDCQGRTLDEAADTGFPELPDPISEAQPTVEPGPATYSTRKAALERVLLDQAVVPLTILRPAAVSGIGSARAREWWFVKRMRDGRPAIPLAYGGRSRFHTSSVANIAALMRVVAGRPGQRILNIADPEALPVSEIAAAIASACGFSGRFAMLPDADSYPPAIGATPWSVRHPFVLDMTAATALGYRPQTGYAATVGPICDSLIQATHGKDWQDVFPVLASYPFDLFDYQAEDALLGNLRLGLPGASLLTNPAPSAMSGQTGRFGRRGHGRETAGRVAVRRPLGGA